MSKILVAYFSASGVTEKAAMALAQAAKADIYEIRPAVPYNASDLDWRDPSSRSSLEMKDPSSRPELADHDAPLSDHELILLGFPIWWYTAPRIIDTFIESYAPELADKKIVLFATSGGSGLGKTDSELQKLLQNKNVSATIINGRLLNGRLSEEDLRKWTEGL